MRQRILGRPSPRHRRDQWRASNTDPPGQPAGVVRYVKAGADGGDGASPSTPFGTITQALVGIPAGATIAIAKGSYTEYVPITRAITLLGACAEQTVITAPSRTASRGTIDIGAAATLKNLQVKGPRPGVWILKNADFAVLKGVIVRKAELVGVFVSDNGRAQLEDVLIEQTLPDPANGTLGRALQVLSGGQVKGTGVVADKKRDVSITLDGAGCSLDVNDLVVRDTQSELASSAFGQSLEVRYGARATITRALFERNRNLAVAIDQAGSAVTLTDVVVQDTLAQENNRRYGGGLEAKPGVSVT